MELNILRADPAGNITIFVLDQVEKAQRAAIAEKIMAIPALKAEQVGYVCPAEEDADGHMEMMGGEFCGNATRAYGMYIARQKGGLSSVKLRVSGCDHIVTAQVDLEAGTARAEMPCPRSVQRITVNGHEGTLVDLTGIAHFVVEGVKPSEEFFRAVEPVFSGIAGLDTTDIRRQVFTLFYRNTGEDNPEIRFVAVDNFRVERTLDIPFSIEDRANTDTID